MGERVQCHLEGLRIGEVLKEVMYRDGMRLEEGRECAELLRVGSNATEIVSEDPEEVE